MLRPRRSLVHPRRSRFRLLLVLHLLCLVFLCSTTSNAKKKKPDLRIAFSIQGIYFYEPVSITAIMRPLFEKLFTERGKTYTMKVFKDASEMMDAFISEDYNTGVASQLVYAQIAEKTETIPLTVDFRLGKPTFKLLLVVQQGANINKLADLKGKKIAMHGPTQMKQVYLKVLLARHGLAPPAKFFSSISYKDKPKAALLDLFMDESDACLVTDYVYHTMTQLNPRLSKKLTVLHASDEFANGITFVKPSMPKSLRDLFINTSLTLNKDKIGHELLRLLKTTKLVHAKTVKNDSIKKLLKDYRELVEPKK